MEKRQTIIIRKILKTKKKFTTIIASFSNTKRHCSSQRREQAHFPHGKCRGTDRGEEDSLGLGTVILLPAPRAQVKAHIEQEATSEQQRTAEHQIQEIHRLVFQVKGWDLVGF